MVDRSVVQRNAGLYYTMLGLTGQSSRRGGLLSIIAAVRRFPKAVASPGGVGYHESGRGELSPAQYLIAEEDNYDHRRATGDQAG